MFVQLVLFAYVLMHVHTDRRDCAVCLQLLPGSRLNLDRSQVRSHCSFLSIKPVYPIQSTETNIPFQANKNYMGDFCVIVWLHYLAIRASASDSHAAFWSFFSYQPVQTGSHCFHLGLLQAAVGSAKAAGWALIICCVL